MNTIEVCFTPELYLHRLTEGKHTVVVVDVLRATTTMVTALEHGVARIIPVIDIEQLVAMKKDGYLVASERDGLQSDFADFGNSPLHFINNPKIKNATIAFSTTNGTRALSFVENSQNVYLGTFSNCSALCEKLETMQEDIVIVCAGWKQRFSLEDSLFAGYLCEKLSKNKVFIPKGDSAYASLSLWKDAKNDLLSYVSKAEHYERLHCLEMHECIPYCFQLDSCRAVPQLVDGTIVKIND